MKNLAVLGATGSIGKSTLNLVRNDPERFNVFSLMANSNVSDMKSLVHEFSPNVVVMNESSAARQLRENINVEVMEGPDGMHAAVTDERIDIVVAGIVGYAGVVLPYSLQSAWMLALLSLLVHQLHLNCPSTNCNPYYLD